MPTEKKDESAINVAKSKKRRRYDLQRLIDDITDDNRHSEINWGPRVGGEVW